MINVNYWTICVSCFMLTTDRDLRDLGKIRQCLIQSDD